MTLSALSCVDDGEVEDTPLDTDGLGPIKAQDACDCKANNRSEAITREFMVVVVVVVVV